VLDPRRRCEMRRHIMCGATCLLVPHRAKSRLLPRLPKATLTACLNHLTELLSTRERARLLGGCTVVDLIVGDVLYRHGDPMRHVYFPCGGFISLVTQTEGEPALEVGMIGFEGMLGASLALGVERTTLHALVQGPGAAWRMGGSEFRRQLAGGTGLRRVVDAYLYVVMAQLARSSACVRFHEIGPRLARWLLMTQDRAHANRFQVTHALLAHMLGVRRVGITVAAGALQERGVIAYERGEMQIIDRQGLQDAACSCYAADSKVYRGLLSVQGTAVPRRSAERARRA
jgi:CRP-like cAMP-binding protein